MTQKQILKKMRELLSDRKRWTKGSMAKTLEGKQCHGDDPKAIKWCVLGALYKVVGTKLFYKPAARGVRDKLLTLIPVTGIGDFNDAESTTHKDVLALLDKALGT